MPSGVNPEGFLIMADKNPQQYTNNNWGNQRKYQHLDANGNLIEDPEMILNNAWADSMNGQSGNVFHDWLFPQVKEGRQMAEQMFLTDRQNEYNSPSNQMERMKKAGINPLTAAAGIAGTGSSTATASPQPSSSVNPLGDVANTFASYGGAFDSVAAGVSTLGKLVPEIDEINSSARKNLASAGLDEVNTDAVITDNKYREDNWEAELNVKRQSYKNMQQELTNMKATHREIMTRVDEMISQIELNGSQKDYYDVMKLKIDEDLRWQKQLNDWCISNKLMIRDSGVDGYIFNMLYNEYADQDVDAFFNSFYDYCKQRSYASAKGLRDAEVETAFDKAFQEAFGKNDADAEFAPYFAKIEANKDALIDLIKTILETPKNARAIVGKLINLLSNMGLAGQLFRGPVNNAKKPSHE